MGSRVGPACFDIVKVRLTPVSESELIVTLAVPALHEGDRHWWPWCCVAGIVLGLIGYSYVRRGRGNAADAE